jgi:hypothetical protein
VLSLRPCSPSLKRTGTDMRVVPSGGPGSFVAACSASPKRTLTMTSRISIAISARSQARERSKPRQSLGPCVRGMGLVCLLNPDRNRGIEDVAVIVDELEVRAVGTGPPCLKTYAYWLQRFHVPPLRLPTRCHVRAS